ncbi:sulfatase-like hydrolase/transferase [Cohnella cellulosilytica]|uniref:sulfatase-like hydrolase/transferase n=1 Tax=Cohnella cellulosilytica TaxID=986710 RepID=UPI0035F00DF9
MTNRPNLVLFVTDDQRFDTIAALGNDLISTPNLDELARSGVAFTQAHIPGGTFGAICMPSRAMLHTGKSLFHLANHGWEIPDDHVMLGETLRSAGYRTFATGKWHNGTASHARSFSEGGEIFFGGMADHWNVPVCRYDPSGVYAETARKIDNPFYQNKAKEVHCDHLTPGKHSTELFGDCAVRWLEEEADERPFMMYVAFMAPHDPRSMPDDYRNLYKPEDIPVPDNYREEHPFDYGIRDMRDEVLEAYPRTREAIRHHIAEYYGMISHLDYEVGRVIAALKKAGKYENTIIVFTADHGLALGRHGLMGKQSNYEHSIRVPLLLAGPGIPSNQIRSTYLYLYDLYPTLCELLGIGVPESVEGQSLVPALLDPGLQHREYLGLAYEDAIRGIKNRRYKLLEYRTETVKETQLFDLETDPDERFNLFGLPEYEDVADELRERLHAIRDEGDDLAHPTGIRFWGRY